MSGRALALVASPATPPDAEADALDAQAAAYEALAAAVRAQAAARRAGRPAPAVASTAPAPLVSRHEIARILSVSLATIDRLDRDDGQPHVRVGEAKRYDVATVLAWHRERTVATPKSPAPPPSAPRSAPDIDAPPPAPPAGVRRVSIGGKRGAR